MTIMNRIIRLFPKKQVDLEELDRRNAKRLANHSVPTVKKTALMDDETATGGMEPDENGMVNGEYEILEREIMPERIFCPDCGGVTLEGLEFCDKCGGDLTNS